MKPSANHAMMLSNIADNCLSMRLRLLNRIVGAIYDQALRPHGIRASQMNILVVMAAYGRSTVQDLCNVMRMDSSTVSRALSILKKNDWVHVEPSGEGKILKFDVSEAGLQKIETVYLDWQRALEKAKDALGASASDAITASGNRHLLAGMTD